MIIEKITTMQRYTLFIAFGILLIGLIVSIALSRKLNKPIQVIVSKLESLETEKSNRAHEVKQELLRSLLQGNDGHSGDSIRQRLAESGVKLDFNGVILVMLFKVDRFEQFCSRYNQKDRGLFKYCVMNIASELISRHFTNEGVDMENDSIVFLLNPTGCTDELLENRLYELMEGIQTNVEKYLEFTISVVMSPVFTGISELSEHYSTARYAMNSRVFFGHSAVIHADRISQSGTKNYTYPQIKEKMLFDALRLGKLQEAESAYLDIIHSLAGYSYAVFQSTITHLAILIGTSFDSTDKSSGEPMVYDLSRLISDVSRMETLEEINEAFRGVFRSIIDRMEDRRSSKHEHLVQDIMTFIKKQYNDTNLSIDSIADAMGLSPIYLGRLFKRLTGYSVADHINGIRMEKAKELLLHSDLSVNEIMEKTGFLSSGYFYTQFKKQHGVTPSQFRQQALRGN
jgi:AraC-like DNA-binding protein